jgi:hypothetical protein
MHRPAIAHRPACAPLEHCQMFTSLGLCQHFAIHGERLRNNEQYLTDILRKLAKSAVVLAYCSAFSMMRFVQAIINDF